MTFEEYYENAQGCVGCDSVEIMAKWAWQVAYQQGFDDGYDSCQEGRSLLDKEDCDG